MIINGVDLYNFNEVVYNPTLVHDSTENANIREKDENITNNFRVTYTNCIGKALEHTSIYIDIDDISLYETYQMSKFCTDTKIKDVVFLDTKDDMLSKLDFKHKYPDIEIYIARLGAYHSITPDDGMILDPIIFTRLNIVVEISGLGILDLTGNMDRMISNINKNMITRDGRLDLPKIKDFLVGNFIQSFHTFLFDQITKTDSLYLAMLEEVYWSKTKFSNKVTVDLLRVYSRLGSLQFIDDNQMKVDDVEGYIAYIRDDKYSDFKMELICNISMYTALLLSLMIDVSPSMSPYLSINIQDIRANRNNSKKIQIASNESEVLESTLNNEELNIRSYICQVEEYKSNILKQAQVIPGNLSTKCVITINANIINDPILELIRNWIYSFRSNIVNEEVSTIIDKIKSFTNLISSI